MSTEVFPAEARRIRCDYPRCQTSIEIAGTTGADGWMWFGDMSGWAYIPKRWSSPSPEAIYADDNDVWTFCPDHPNIREQIEVIQMVLDANSDS